MNLKAIFVFFLILFSLKYFDLVYAQQGLIKYVGYGYMLLAISISIPYLFKYKDGFVIPVQIICFAIFISLFMAHYTWGQGLEYSSTTIPYAMWFTFFLLMRLKVPIKTIENIVIIYGIVYILLFLFQFTHNNTVYFGTQEAFKLDRGIIRINFPGAGVFFLSCFIAINKVTSVRNYKLIWLLYSIFGFSIVVLQVTRQTIIYFLIIYLFHFIKNLKLKYKISTIVCLLIVSVVFFQSDTTISKGLIEQQKEDASAGGSYIRILAAKYYLTEFTPNTISKIFGNGFFNDTSNYGKALISISENYGFYLSDVGLVEIYITFGIFATIGCLMIFIKSITIPLPNNYQYLKYYLWMLIFTSLTSDTFISYNFLITTVIVTYCYQYIYEYKKKTEKIVYKYRNLYYSSLSVDGNY